VNVDVIVWQCWCNECSSKTCYSHFPPCSVCRASTVSVFTVARQLDSITCIYSGSLQLC